MHRPPRRLTAALLTLAAALLSACGGDSPTPPPAGPRVVPVTLSVSVNGQSIAGLVVEVSGPGIATTITATMAPNASGTATGSVNVPLGLSRKFVVHAFDVKGIETHRGEKTTDLGTPPIPTLAVTLAPLSGGAPVEVTLGSYAVTLSPAQVTLTVGQTFTPQVTVADAEGRAVVPGGAAGTLTIATGNPGLLASDASGVLEALAPGTTTVTAAYGGAAGTMQVTVVPASYAALSAGGFHTCTDDGRCWGWNPSGALGDNSTTDRSTLGPTAAAAGLRGTRAGGHHSCAVDASQALRCWGENSFGQLGNGTLATSLTPTAVSLGGTIASVASATSSTCAVTGSGRVYCWGYWPGAPLGLTTPSEVATGGLQFTQVGVGSGSACGIGTTGTVYCWGANAQGQLGDATYTTRSDPKPIAEGGFTAAAVSVGEKAACAMSRGSSPEVRCWGLGWVSGEGAPVPKSQPRLMAFLTPVTVVDVSVGALNACALTSTGAVYCWGDNSRGQVGMGIVGTSAGDKPALVAGGRRFYDVTVGGQFVCAAADDGYYCWGRNDHGQLGDGTTVDRSVPTKVVVAP